MYPYSLDFCKLDIVQATPEGSGAKGNKDQGENPMNVLSVIVLLIACLFHGGQDQVLKEFSRAFRPARHPADVHERREAALAALCAAGNDRNAAAEMVELLLDAHCQLEKEIAPILSERCDYLAGKRKSAELKMRIPLDPLRELQEGISSALLGLTDRAAVELEVSRALSDQKLGLSLRIALAQRAGEIEGIANDRIDPLLRRSKNTGALLVGLAAARGLGRSAHGLGDRVLSLLEHPEPAVRESAAAALATMCVIESLVVLIERLDKEPARTSDRIAGALQILTRRNFGTSAHAWQRWLESEGKPFIAGERALGGGEVTVAQSSAPRYHQIPMDGVAIIYVIDCSLSMNRTMTKPSEKAGEGDESRFTRARDELLRALRNLSPAKSFNIIAFETRCRCFAKRMMPADARTIAEAEEWVRELDLKFGTQLYDALESAFSLAGRGTEDRYYDTAADTIFVLTDGIPYIGNKADKFPKILAAVKRWNLLRRVVIHTIGMGDGIPEKWLKRLAAENGGKFVHELSREKK